jgi:hypothetical protein
MWRNSIVVSESNERSQLHILDNGRWRIHLVGATRKETSDVEQSTGPGFAGGTFYADSI